VGVSWNDAKAFCAWLTEREHRSGALPEGMQNRLPTDEEWSVAVGLPLEPEKMPEDKDSKINLYPWGKKWPPPARVGNYRGEESKIGNEPVSWRMIKDYNDGYSRTSPVGSFAANESGLYDMGGNVWQWCEDWYNSEKRERVLRGASWYEYDPRYLLASRRYRYMPDERGVNIGFRCVLLRPEQPITEAPNLQT
jgi:formylglycine-generating enzyme required for sulfatase activity